MTNNSKKYIFNFSDDYKTFCVNDNTKGNQLDTYLHDLIYHAYKNTHHIRLV